MSFVFLICCFKFCSSVQVVQDLSIPLMLHPLISKITKPEISEHILSISKYIDAQQEGRNATVYKKISRSNEYNVASLTSVVYYNMVSYSNGYCEPHHAILVNTYQANVCISWIFNSSAAGGIKSMMFKCLSGNRNILSHFSISHHVRFCRVN